MFRTVLVPLDGSPFAEQALPLALSLASRSEADLHLARVHQFPLRPLQGDELTLDPVLDDRLREAAREYLAGAEERVQPLLPRRVRSALLEGAVADCLRRHAGEIGADLIVMTTHGRGPLSRLWLGSVADTLLREVALPVLLVRPQHPAAEPAAPVVSRVVVPLDGSDLAEAILEPAAALGSAFDAEFTLLRAVEPVIVADYHAGGNALVGLEPGLLRKVRDAAELYLEGVAIRLRARGLRVRTRVTVERPAAAVILDEAGARPGQVIALHSHGRAGLSRLLLGSVADKVIRGAACPVLVQCPPSHR
jgi:nucleotide-binding universal stress UspA family protein